MKIYIVCRDITNYWFSTITNKVDIFYTKEEMNAFIVKHKSEVIYWTCKKIKKGIK